MKQSLTTQPNKRNRSNLFHCSLLLVGLSGCAGPMALYVAMRDADRAEYNAVLERFEGEEREAFLRWRAEQKGVPYEEALADDEKLTDNPFEKDDRRAISLGAIVFEKQCKACHGSEADGMGVMALVDYEPKDFTSTMARLSLSGGPSPRWFKKVRDGDGPVVEYSFGESRAMPAFAERLSNEQIWLALTYLASSKGDADDAESSGDDAK